LAAARPRLATCAASADTVLTTEAIPMNHFRLPRPPLRAIALLVVPLVAGGCYAWQTVKVEPRALIAADHPSKVRVTIHDSARQVLLNPVTAGDTLLGVRESRENGRVAIGLHDITRLEVYRQAPARTAGLLVLAVGTVAAIVVIDNWLEGFCFGSCPS
jgi:hypothetical protein